jgi:pyridoxine 4-dehydrogenase
LQISASVTCLFEKYPEYTDLAFLFVKGGCLPGKLDVDGSRANLCRSIDNTLRSLRGKKRLDLFQFASHDPNYEIEHYAEVLNESHGEGKFDYISLSELGAAPVRHAHKVRTLFYLTTHARVSAYCMN